jgi:acetyl esterase/lipase
MTKGRVTLLGRDLPLSFFAALFLMAGSAQAEPVAKEEGRVVAPSATVPFSRFGSAEARAMFAQELAAPPIDWSKKSIAEVRAYYDARNKERVRRFRELYKVEIKPGTLGGVPVETILPTAGVSARNKDRILINLHGGSFMFGSGSGGEVESIPIAALGRIAVVTVDYRMAPEHRFPAASQDVEAVYRELLKRYPAQGIGIYGCSAGAVLTGEAIAWLRAKGLPRPGGAGTFCGSIAQVGGDSAFIASALNGRPVGKSSPSMVASSNGYLAGASDDDPLVVPANSPELLAAFPPTILITGTRDFALSNVIQSHRLLTNAGVDAELHVWDGMWHGFFNEPDLPESKEAHLAITRFFDRVLAVSPPAGY